MSSSINKIDIAVLVAKLNSVRKPHQDGTAGFEGLLLDDILTVLDTVLDLSPELPPLERRLVLRRAAFAAGGKGIITETALLAEIKKHQATYLSTPKAPYVLATSLSIKSSHFARPLIIRMQNSTMTLSDHLPTRFDREAFAQLFAKNKHEPLPRGYASIRVHVWARSGSEAVTNALDELDNLRGIWNWSLNRLRGFRWNSGPPTPINQIVTGPVHTLHSPSGKPNLDIGYWHEPFFVGGAHPGLVDSKWSKIRSAEKIVRSLLKLRGVRGEIEGAFRRYTRALDGIDFQSSFLKLWSLLEYLTGTERADYNQTIRRCLFLESDREFERQILQHLREQRNSTVHQSKDPDNFETLVFQLKRYVEFLISYHLRFAGRFGSMGEACEFMDLPHSPSVLRDRIAQYRRALKFRSEFQEPPN